MHQGHSSSNQFEMLAETNRMLCCVVRRAIWKFLRLPTTDKNVVSQQVFCKQTTWPRTKCSDYLLQQVVVWSCWSQEGDRLSARCILLFSVPFICFVSTIAKEGLPLAQTVNGLVPHGPRSIGTLPASFSRRGLPDSHLFTVVSSDRKPRIEITSLPKKVEAVVRLTCSRLPWNKIASCSTTNWVSLSGR